MAWCSRMARAGVSPKIFFSFSCSSVTSRPSTACKKPRSFSITRGKTSSSSNSFGIKKENMRMYRHPAAWAMSASRASFCSCV